MLLKTSRNTIQIIFSYLSKLPFAKNIVHKISEASQGPGIVFFSLHRLLPEDNQLIYHPHFQNGTALTPKLLKINLLKICESLEFIDIFEAIEILTGSKSISKSHAVLLLETPYEQTIKLVAPILEKLKIPASILLSSNMLKNNFPPWHDEIVYRVFVTEKQNIKFSFIDRIFPLVTILDRKSCAEYLIENLSFCEKNKFKNRMFQIREILAQPISFPAKERIANKDQLQKLGLHSLFSFVYAGHQRLPLTNCNPKDFNQEATQARKYLYEFLGSALVPVFCYPPKFDSKNTPNIIRLLQENQFEAAIGPNVGVARPGDNMFCLPSLPLSQNTKSFEQFELQDLANAIDELLLVTLAKENKF